MSSDGYFSNEAGGTPTKPGYFTSLDAREPFPLTSGVLVRSILGELCMVNFVEFALGGAAPAHAHAEEQVVLVLEGEVEFGLGDDVKVLGPRDAVVVSPWVVHTALCVSEGGARTIEVFGPPRAALLELMGISLPI